MSRDLSPPFQLGRQRHGTAIQWPWMRCRLRLKRSSALSQQGACLCLLPPPSLLLFFCRQTAQTKRVEKVPWPRCLDTLLAKQPSRHSNARVWSVQLSRLLRVSRQASCMLCLTVLVSQLGFFITAKSHLANPPSHLVLQVPFRLSFLLSHLVLQVPFRLSFLLSFFLLSSRWLVISYHAHH